MHLRVGDLLQLAERQQVVVPIEPALAAVHDAAILGQHPRLGAEHPRVGVAAVVPLDLRLGRAPCASTPLGTVFVKELDVTDAASEKGLVKGSASGASPAGEAGGCPVPTNACRPVLL